MYGGQTCGRMAREDPCEETSPVGLRNKLPDPVMADKPSVQGQPSCRAFWRRSKGNRRRVETEAWEWEQLLEGCPVTPALAEGRWKSLEG